jgi:hypothetical protein
VNIAYYLTSHGYGHSVRACAVCAHLSPNVSVHFRTMVPESFFREELKRPFAWSAGSFDCGCLQSDSVTVDVEATLRSYQRIAAENRSKLVDEVAWCRDQAIDGIVADIPPFALEIGRSAGIPTIALANFTWRDVYAEYLDDYPGFHPFLQEMEQQYARAGLLLEVAPALPMGYFARRTPVGIIGRPGRNVREKLRTALGIPAGKRLALLYLGTFGMDLPWNKLERFRNWAFLTLDALPDAPANAYVFSKSQFRFADVAASCDLVVSKLGYGIVTGCMLDGVPLLYLPRRQFAEYPALEAEVDRWGHGYRLSQEQFRALEWGEALEAASGRARPEPVADKGAAECARAIERFVAAGGKG